MDGYSKFISYVQAIASEVINSKSITDFVALQLKAVDPLKFQKTAEIILEEEDGELIIPRGLKFAPDDINKWYIFAKNTDGQQYIFMHEGGKTKL